MSSAVRQRHVLVSKDTENTEAGGEVLKEKTASNEEQQLQTKGQQQQQPGPRRVKKNVSKVDRYSILLSCTFFILLYLTGLAFPDLTHKFTTLQYKFPGTVDAYDIGIDDAYVVITCIVALVLVRSFLLEFVLKPIALNRFHVRSHKSQQRYAEQGWSLVYYTFSWVYGFYLYYKSPYFLNCDHIYLGWPHDYLSGTFKLYYLLQMASWLQQILVLNVEEKRKDFWQMFAHHIITCLLTLGSYYYYFTRIGHVILIIMDVVDILLSSAKMLKYCGFSTACDYMFAIFLVFWVLLRHIAYNYIFYHAGTKAPGLMANGQCMVSKVQKRCWTPFIIDVFLWLLGGLQVITIIWMALIVKVLIKIIKGGSAEDVRSDADDSD
ncbi:LAME_0G12508g1_1 [Lachancea meyersii CBS 8951]|uniref:LAME_0G12508g1_1 n=1 Tax=Lachancea meyersii CBS 8951 TaxID=1266667 RepID=A0A1G4K9W1_9SACH|nr:LAME_0G12508g1_1 [Lachancea meyersii CBS 8951]